MAEENIKLALGGLKLALDITKALQSFKVAGEAKAKLSHLYEALLDSQSHANAAYAREAEHLDYASLKKNSQAWKHGLARSSVTSLRKFPGATSLTR